MAPQHEEITIICTFQKVNFRNTHQKRFIQLCFGCFSFGCSFVLFPHRKTSKKLVFLNSTTKNVQCFNSRVWCPLPIRVATVKVVVCAKSTVNLARLHVLFGLQHNRNCFHSQELEQTTTTVDGCSTQVHFRFGPNTELSECHTSSISRSKFR